MSVLVGGSQGGKEPARQQLQQKYQPRFQGSLPPVPAERERGRRENLGTRLQKCKISGSTQFEKLD